MHFSACIEYIRISILSWPSSVVFIHPSLRTKKHTGSRCIGRHVGGRLHTWHVSCQMYAIPVGNFKVCLPSLARTRIVHLAFHSAMLCVVCLPPQATGAAEYATLQYLVPYFACPCSTYSCQLFTLTVLDAIFLCGLPHCLPLQAIAAANYPPLQYLVPYFACAP